MVERVSSVEVNEREYAFSAYRVKGLGSSIDRSQPSGTAYVIKLPIILQ